MEYAPASNTPLDIRSAPIQDTEDTFAGSDACRICHAAIYQNWMATRHAHQLTGEEYASPPHRGNCSRCHHTSGGEGRVGCEACHGPRAGHAACPQPAEPVSCRQCDIRKVCIQCHILSVDPKFDPDRGWKKIDHGKNR